MKSIERLVAEHDIIVRGINLLEKAVAQIESGQSVPDDFSKWAPQLQDVVLLQRVHPAFAPAHR